MDVYENQGKEKQCPICAAMMPENASFCPICGTPMNPANFYSANSPQSEIKTAQSQVQGKEQVQENGKDDSITYGILALILTLLFSFIGFIIAIVGLTRPNASKTTKTLCWVSIGLLIAKVILIVIIVVIVLNSFTVAYSFEKDYVYNMLIGMLRR